MLIVWCYIHDVTMPVKVSAQQWETFANHIELGRSKMEAASAAGISYNQALRVFSTPYETSAPVKVIERLQPHQEGPRPYSSLKQAAKDSLHDFELFRRRYFGRVSVGWQLDAANQLTDLLGAGVGVGDKRYVVVNVAPGSGKSSLFTHDLIAWWQTKNRRLRCMIGSRTESQASLYTARLRYSYMRTKPIAPNDTKIEMGLEVPAQGCLVADYGRYKPVRPDMWRRDEFYLAQYHEDPSDDKEPSVRAYGMDTGLLGGRYDVVVWDDLVDKASSRTPESREKLIEWFETEAETRLEPGGVFILQGQRVYPEDLYKWAVELGDHTLDGRKYTHIIYKAHYDEKCPAPGDAESTAHTPDAPAWPHGCLLDPRRLRFTDLAVWKSNKFSKYALTYQQEDVDPDDALVRREWIYGTDGHPGCLEPRLGVPKGLKGDWYSIMSVDPSATHYWAIFWFIYQLDPPTLHVVDLVRDRIDAPEFLDWNASMGEFTGIAEDWWHRANDYNAPITHVIYEANAAFRHLLQYEHTHRWQYQRGVRILAHATQRNKIDPEFGVQMIGPWYERGAIRIPTDPRFQPMIDEALRYPNGNTDDTVMATWFALHNAPLHLHPRLASPYRMPRPSWLKPLRRR